MNLNLEIVDITSENEFRNFNCDNTSLNVYLEREAYFEHIMRFTNTKLVKINNEVIAYFSMQFKQINIVEELDDIISYPAIYLKCIAVDKEYEGKGIGSSLIEYITIQSKDISLFIGCRCLIIDALREKVEWYKYRGFQFLDSEDNINKYDVTVPMFIDFRDDELVIDYFEEG